MKKLLGTSLCICLAGVGQIWSQESALTEQQIKPDSLKMEAPSLALRNVSFGLKIQALRADGTPDPEFSGLVKLQGVVTKDESDGLRTVDSVMLTSGSAVVSKVVMPSTGKHIISADGNGTQAELQLRVIPGILSLLPPLLAIGLAF
ncbi:hypothetical protein MJD09_22460, partial [bacterium]|nr:hypothetical protein [bacterium]